MLINEEPSEDNYLLLGYEDVLKIIEQHLEFNKETIADAIHDFLSFYIEVLKEQLVHDEEAVQLALEVYEGNKSAIDYLFLSQNKNFQKQTIYKGIYKQIGEFSDREKTALRKIYESKKKTIDFIFNIGSNVLREAFLEFVKETEIPEEVYSPSIRSPNFVLPDWFDFEETLGKPDSAYWLGQAFIIWFERQVEDRIKITVEVGPIPYEERYQLLTMLEKHGVSFQQNAKQEGKKYTKIYTAWTEVKDWASKQEVLNSMMELYNAPEINDLFQKIALSVEGMAQQEEAEEMALVSEGIEQEEKLSVKKVPSIPRAAFQKFCEENGITEENRNIHPRYPSFIVPAFAKIEERFGSTRINWWWHKGPFLFFFDHLRDGRLKLVFELGPLHGEQRVALIEELEAFGVTFKAASKLRTAKYTRLYSNTKVVEDWNDGEQVSGAMTELFEHSKHQELLEVIGRIGSERSDLTMELI